MTKELNVELSPKSKEEIKSGKIKSKIINHEETFFMEESIDTWPIIKLFVRIAYEIAFYKLGDDYFNDPMRDKLKNYLESDDKYIEDLKTRHGISIHFLKDNEVNEAIFHLAKATYKDDNLLHYITILPARVNGINAINLVVTLFNRLSANVLISEDFNMYEINGLNAIMMFKNNGNKYTKEFPKN
ncbi:hypothetical protein [Methanobrevibacter arboriphilus]|uniref:hypothetical protein n=1 Tax=Methanobrevibacter arboriphilus TaxID=39441 RepID=UPI000ADD21CD|nr:hypothetical protein [Methanobrevibacter arboriphilus]